MPRSLNFENENNLLALENVCGFYHLGDLENSIGSVANRVELSLRGWAVGIEVAEMLQSRGIEVDFIVREPDYWRSQITMGGSSSSGAHQVGRIRLHLSDEVASVRREGRVIREFIRRAAVLESDLFVVSIGFSPILNFLEPVNPDGLGCACGRTSVHFGSEYIRSQ